LRHTLSGVLPFSETETLKLEATIHMVNAEIKLHRAIRQDAIAEHRARL
jgi:hypothetical protein